MSAIPEGRELAETIIDAVEGCGCDECLEKATKLATLALLARDERAAKIARDYPFTEIFEHHKNHAVACNASQNIADMIEGRFTSAIRDRSKT